MARSREGDWRDPLGRGHLVDTAIGILAVSGAIVALGFAVLASGAAILFGGVGAWVGVVSFRELFHERGARKRYRADLHVPLEPGQVWVGVSRYHYEILGVDDEQVRVRMFQPGLSYQGTWLGHLGSWDMKREYLYLHLSRD